MRNSAFHSPALASLDVADGGALVKQESIVNFESSRENSPTGLP